MARKLTCDLGVGVGELAADDDLVRLCPIEVTMGFGKLVEEVADQPLSALIQILEVGGELDGGVSTGVRRWSDTDFRCGIYKINECLTRGEDGAAEEHRRNPR